jgi:hypothetical protein
MDDPMSVTDFSAVAQLPSEVPVGEIAGNLMVSTYHQAGVISAEDHNDWAHLPAIRITSAAHRAPPETHTVHDKYHIWGHVLFNCWSCSVAECLPVELRERTPYSLALLARMKDLALASAGQMTQAHSLLRQQCSFRQEKEAVGFVAGDVIISPGAATGHAEIVSVEEFIKENPRGITLHDVDKTIAAIANCTADAYTAPSPGMMTQLEEMKDVSRHDSGMDDSMQMDTADATTNGPKLGYDDRSRDQYHQPEGISAEDVDDWQQLPTLLPERQVARLDFTARDAYCKLANGFDNLWQCSIAECVPAEFRISTPYSLALVGSLQKLAKLTVGGRDHAHTVLKESWTVRQQREASELQSVPFIVTRNAGRALNVRKFVERSIQERPHGLMLKDVNSTMEIIKLSRGFRPFKKLAKRAETRAVAREKRPQKKKAAKESKADTDLIQVQGTVLPAGMTLPKRAESGMENHLADNPSLQQYIKAKEEEAYRRGLQDAARHARKKPVGLGTPDSPIDIEDEEPSARLAILHRLYDAKNDVQMSRALRSFGMERHRSGKKDKAAAKRQLRSNALPSERFNPASMGQLPLPFFDAESMKKQAGG